MRVCLVAMIAVMLAGCAKDQGSTLSCPGPGATGCDSLSTVYERTTQEPAKVVRQEVRLRTTPLPSKPQYSPPRLLRVWIAPWKDEDGDLHDQQHLYLVLEPASWSIGLVEPIAGEGE